MVWHRERDGLAGDDLVRRVGQLEQHVVRTRAQANQYHRLTAGIDEVPRRVVHCYVEMTDARRHVERLGGRVCAGLPSAD